MTLAGALIRVWFVMRHKGKAPGWVLAAGLLCIAFTAVLLSPETQPAAGKVGLAEIRPVIDARCVTCHARKPSFQGIAEAPKGVLLDADEGVRTHAVQIHRQAVLSKAMPPGNLTGMTEEERRQLDLWYRGGAR
jgi:uncharacterized membrane protein